MNSFNKIALPTIKLIEPHPSQAAFFFELMNSEGYLKNIGDRVVHSEELAQQYIEQKIIPGRSSIWGYRVITAHNQCVGIVGLLNRPNLPDPDLGFALLPQFEGQGFARAASITLLNEYAQALSLDLSLPHFMSGITNTDNTGSQNVLLALGFSFDQRLPWNGERVDVYRRSMKDFTPLALKSDRCGRCFIDPCSCDQTLIESETIELLMISHCEELKRYSSTGRVAARALAQSYLIEQGRLSTRASYNSLNSIESLIEEKADYATLILSADSEAQPMEQFVEKSLRTSRFMQNKSKVFLIAVDGSWRQASKLTRKLAKRFGLTKVRFANFELAREHEAVIRQEHFENGRSTLQAVAEAYFQLGEVKVAHQLMALYQKKLAEATRRRANIRPNR